MESDSVVPDPTDARRALDAVASARARMTLTRMTPRWFWPAANVALGIFIAALALPDPSTGKAIRAIVGFAPLVILVACYLIRREPLREADGRWRVMQWRQVPLLAPRAVVAASFMALAWWLHLAGWVFAPVVLGVLAVPVVTIVDWRRDAARRAELQAQV